MNLRPYQADAVAAVYRHLRERDDQPCVVIPTGGGKTPIIATIARDCVQTWQGRILLLAHVRELLTQTAAHLDALDPRLNFGVYCAGLGRRELRRAALIASIQSVYQKAEALGPVDLVIVDEGHLIPLDGEGMYRTLLENLRWINPQLRVIGFTATPYRLDAGPICRPDGLLNQVCYEVGVRDLITRGFLSPLKAKASREKTDTSNLSVRAGDFVASELEALLDDDARVRAAVAEIRRLALDRVSILIFCAGVTHARHVARVLQEQGESAGVVTGDTDTDERDRLIQDFRAGRLRLLCNVQVLTVGFDAPNVDCVVLLRPTLSPGLYYQQVGRGFRLCTGKSDCLVLDFAGNVLRHGPVDGLTPPSPATAGKRDGAAPLAKECPECAALVALATRTCECGHEFYVPERTKHATQASGEPILGGATTTETHEVEWVGYRVHVKRNAPNVPKTLKVEYRTGLNRYVSEWVCLEHEGYARDRAEQWWRLRGCDPVPTTAYEACERSAELRRPTHVVVEKTPGSRFPRVVGYQWPVEEAEDALEIPELNDPVFLDRQGRPLVCLDARQAMPDPNEETPF